LPNLRLTKETVREIKPPDSGEVFYWDTKTIGFGLRVGPRTMTYFVQARTTNAAGRTTRIKIGRAGVLTPDQAEKQAKILLGRIAMGEDPNAERIDLRARAVTLQDLFDEYKRVKKLREKTLSVYDSAMRRCFGDWLDKPFLTITKDMVQKRHQSISNANGPRGKGEAQANQAMRVLRSLLNYSAVAYEDSEGRSILPENPVRRLSQTRTWNKIPRRQDIVPLEKLEDWYGAVNALDNETMRDYLLLCLFTGLRRSEAVKLTWKHVDLDSRILLIPAENTKADRAHGLPLSDFLHDLLRRRSKVRRLGNDYVFPARTGPGYLIEPKRAIEKVTSASGVKFSMHTLRRTFETIAERLDIPYYALKRLLNHSTAGDVTAGYIVIGVERLREPMQKITNFIKQHAGVDKIDENNQQA
jgi:integrase